MRYRWGFRRVSALRWALVLCLEDEPERAVRAPGFESAKAGDIIKACMYLNYGWSGYLSDRTVQLLDAIREETVAAVPGYVPYLRKN